MCLIAHGAEVLARWDRPKRRKKGLRGGLKGLSQRGVFARGKTL